jgi:hypothetical protein
MATTIVWNTITKNIVASNGENNMSLLRQFTLKLKLGVRK